MADDGAAAGGMAGRFAVITGASRGIGLATARLFAGAGARVVMLARGEDALRREAAPLGALAVPLACDLADRAAIERAVASIRDSLGAEPDVVVNNAGAFPLDAIEQTSTEQFAATLDVNLVGPFQLVRAFLPAMHGRGSGHLVTVGSIADRVTFPGNAAYAASKFGARALHQVLREETRGSGVRATLVSPGPVDTPLWDPHDPDSREGFPPRSAMLEAAAVADAILYAVTRPQTVNIDELRLSRT